MTSQKILDTANLNASMAKLNSNAQGSSSPTVKSPNEADCPLKSVREKEELDLLQTKKSGKLEAEHRKKNREQFHERQRELAERKKSKVPKPKGKIMVNPHLMSSPMQTLGKVSLINKR